MYACPVTTGRGVGVHEVTDVEIKTVHEWGTASGWVRADIAAAREVLREVLRDYRDVALYVDEKTGTVYASLPGTYLMTGLDSAFSGGCIALANRRCYWDEVYGGGMPGRWSDWVGRAYADGALGVRVGGLGEDYAGLNFASWIDDLVATPKLVLLHTGFGGSEYLLRVDAWDVVAESVAALDDYPCLSDDYASAAETEYIWDYVSEEVVRLGLAEGVGVDDIGAFDFAMCGVLHDLDCAYRFTVSFDLSVDDSGALNPGGWSRAITLGAAAWLRGGCCRADVVAASEWAGAADGDGANYSRFVLDGDIGTRWGPSGADGNADDAETPDYFSGRAAWAALLGDGAGE